MPYLNSGKRGDLLTEVIVTISGEPAKKLSGWRGEAFVALISFIIASADFLLRLQHEGALTPGSLIIFIVHVSGLLCNRVDFIEGVSGKGRECRIIQNKTDIFTTILSSVKTEDPGFRP